MNDIPPRLVITSGEPAGIGPDLCLQLKAPPAAELVVLGDRELIARRAQLLDIAFDWPEYDPDIVRPGQISLQHIPLEVPCEPGQLDAANANYVLALIRQATMGCLTGEFAAMVTAPIHKGIINEAGARFSGHTEYLAELCNIDTPPVMMLATEGLRVALATTHLPLAEVSRHISRESLTTILTILNNELRSHFGIETPSILVCGLNPHAGENGHLGREEIDVIEPALAALREQGLRLQGPLPADTLFTPPYLEQADAVLAMYHDQGLPVLKHMGFGRAVNITLGLPIIRTSVDHGTALDLAGTGRADAGSMAVAINTALEMVRAA
ncbi:4-hydroxythreonine-4-phosphate dehydrogenase PdxA [Sulfuriflexus sp.]|uniref:4-hydroxythreonine-4-phosphate dehydrogenase PdxA n=1 Tax=Sulfuriflexus sp. TaxID=2015443 RepID=UPI0028CC0640|nr:4-hydroxythreonine-4-phosphate dehydrogenase PdxA [Sulfuriflexus sp.]MDT8403346.1 4-hydroxythreonine-4-phosphate dehydrogenase PdxA [Sulfuriflexus sp.]